MHEQSITFRSRRGKYKGKVVNTKGIHQGRRINADEADTLLEQGKLRPLGNKTFRTLKEGATAASERSQAYGREIDRIRRKEEGRRRKVVEESRGTSPRRD